jgi:hypothetical protein
VSVNDGAALDWTTAPCARVEGMRPYLLALGAIALGSGLATATLSRPVAAAPPATAGHDVQPIISTCPSSPRASLLRRASRW